MCRQRGGVWGLQTQHGWGTVGQKQPSACSAPGDRGSQRPPRGGQVGTLAHLNTRRSPPHTALGAAPRPLGSDSTAAPGVGEGPAEPCPNRSSGMGCSVGTAAARRIPLLIDLASCCSQMFAAAGTQSSGAGSAAGSVGHKAWAGLTAHQGRVHRAPARRVSSIPAQKRSPNPGPVPRRAAPTALLLPSCHRPSSSPPPSAALSL